MKFTISMQLQSFLVFGIIHWMYYETNIFITQTKLWRVASVAFAIPKFDQSNLKFGNHVLLVLIVCYINVYPGNYMMHQCNEEGCYCVMPETGDRVCQR